MAKQKRPYHIMIAYKSGHTVDFWCEDFSLQFNTIKRTVSWTNASPRPLLVGVDDIETVWLLNPNDDDGAVV